MCYQRNVSRCWKFKINHKLPACGDLVCMYIHMYVVVDGLDRKQPPTANLLDFL
jgi:hypothetical protein